PLPRPPLLQPPAAVVTPLHPEGPVALVVDPAFGQRHRRQQARTEPGVGQPRGVAEPHPHDQVGAGSGVGRRVTGAGQQRLHGEPKPVEDRAEQQPVLVAVATPAGVHQLGLDVGQRHADPAAQLEVEVLERNRGHVGTVESGEALRPDGRSTAVSDAGEVGVDVELVPPPRTVGWTGGGRRTGVHGQTVRPETASTATLDRERRAPACGQALCRGTRVTGCTTDSSMSTFPAQSARTAPAAICSTGWVTVVSDGRASSASGTSSNPMTATSSGIRAPAFASAARAPSAIASVTATIASVSGQRRSTVWAPIRPPFSERSTDTVRGGSPCAARSAR